MNPQKALRNCLVLYLKGSNINKPKEVANSGFTLIELLVVIILIGILSAIALPSFLSQASKGKQAEAKLYLSSINKAQQAYYLENSSFVTNISEIGKLGIGLSRETTNYKYTIEPVEESGVVAIAKPNNNNSLKGYISGVGLVYPGGSSELATLTALCESKDVGAPALALSPTSIAITTGDSNGSGGSVTCGAQTVAVK